MKKVFVINLKGEKEPFSFKKVFQSAKKAGASSSLAHSIAKEIETMACSGIETKKIFSKVKQLLEKEDQGTSLRFTLKKAMQKLGPSGFPFEKYIAEIFTTHGFRVEINKKVNGKHAQHEIDFIAKKNKLAYIGECKFRISPGEKIDLPITLAVWARYLDTRDKFKGSVPIIVTNAKFSSQAKKYAKGVGMELLGWNYPKNKGLEKLIEQEGLYPITILPSFKGFLADVFLDNRLMLAKDILKYSPEKLASKLGVSEKKILPFVGEARALLGDKG